MGSPPSLTSRQRAELRSRARKLRPGASVGKGGLTDSALVHLRDQLARAELLKVRLAGPSAADRRALAHRMANALDAEVVDLIGRMVVLYRPGGRPRAGGQGRQD
ncbi:hypothetical protein LCGC14_2345470 [marine sediment metagenome]|uniref:CRM domain-containing protein n=1 Tax=marine sediment metagenome TaxID=412755 RepID=A0A0F9CAN1_9ZZZZ